jgi:L-2-hydroxyglutarate oxidase LhgO
MHTYDFTIIGGGIVGLSIAVRLGQQYPEARIAVLEKEAYVAAHQTGNNSGVIHSGIYYKPGSLKAKFSCEGSHSMVAFCQKYSIVLNIRCVGRSSLPPQNKRYLCLRTSINVACKMAWLFPG